MFKKDNKPTAVAVGGGVGGALGWLVVLGVDIFSDVVLTPEQASGATAALSVVFGFAVRYLPEPKN